MKRKKSKGRKLNTITKKSSGWGYYESRRDMNHDEIMKLTKEEYSEIMKNRDSSGCSYCPNCSYCFYKIFNVPFTEEEYKQKIKEWK